jgi:hypothetical protein
MAQDFVTVPLPSSLDPNFQELSKLLDTAEESADGKRVVVLGEVPAAVLSHRTQVATGKVVRPYVVHAVREDGVKRTWFVSTRDGARTLSKAYKDHGGSAKVQDTRKKM